MVRNIDKDNKSQVPYYDSLEYQIKLARQGAHRLRAFCITLAIALTGSICLTLVSIMLAVGAIHKANRLEYRQLSMHEDIASMLDLRDELRESNQKVLLEVWQSVPDVLHKVETDIAHRLASFEKEVDSTVEQLQQKSNSELDQFSVRLQKELNNMDVDLKKVQAIFRNLSASFVSVEENNRNMLTAREKLLLSLLARETNPRNPDLNLRCAEGAYTFGHYERADDFASFALGLDAASPMTIQKAQTLKSNIQKSEAKPPRLHHDSPGRTRVGPYGIFELHYNTLRMLVRNGQLTLDDAQNILDHSKQSIRVEP